MNESSVIIPNAEATQAVTVPVQHWREERSFLELDAMCCSVCGKHGCTTFSVFGARCAEHDPYSKRRAKA